MKNAIKGAAKGLALKVKQKMEGFSNSSMSLLIKKRAQNIGTIKNAIKTQYLQKRL